MNRKLCCLLILTSVICSVFAQKKDYLIAANYQLKNEQEWMSVVKELAKMHHAPVFFYRNSLTELLDTFKEYAPRYVCVVEKAENLNRDFVIEGNRISRKIDNDIYADYLWGIITGYTAKDAMRIVEQSKKPFVVETALSSTSEVKSGIWFNKLVWLDDGIKGEWGEKTSPNEQMTIKKANPINLLNIFTEKWTQMAPDLILSSSHATQKNLEMPFSTGNILSKNGRLYANFIESQYIPQTSRARIYFPVGNCLIGDINNDKESMAVAWLSSGGATAMAGYVVSTWYGRNGWGALKFWLSAPAKHTFAEAVFLNQQDMLTYEYKKNPERLKINPNFEDYGDNAITFIEKDLELLSDSVSKDDVGFMYDRDVLAYYGDPKWDARLKDMPEYTGYEISLEKHGKGHVVILKTNRNFSIDRIVGRGFKEVHVGDIPIAYFFPERIKNPKINDKDKHKWQAVLNEDFILIYNKNIKPNEIYKIFIEEIF